MEKIFPILILMILSIEALESKKVILTCPQGYKAKKFRDLHLMNYNIYSGIKHDLQYGEKLLSCLQCDFSTTTLVDSIHICHYPLYGLDRNHTQQKNYSMIFNEGSEEKYTKFDELELKANAETTYCSVIVQSDKVANAQECKNSDIIANTTSVCLNLLEMKGIDFLEMKSFEVRTYPWNQDELFFWFKEQKKKPLKPICFKCANEDANLMQKLKLIVITRLK